jgi:hypothetical protein
MAPWADDATTRSSSDLTSSIFKSREWLWRRRGSIGLQNCRVVEPTDVEACWFEIEETGKCSSPRSPISLNSRTPDNQPVPKPLRQKHIPLGLCLPRGAVLALGDAWVTCEAMAGGIKKKNC